MNAPAEPAHSRFGGSIAARILGCPASVRRVEEVPEYLRRSSAYAERGTALHASMVLLLDNDPPSLESFAGKTFNGYIITSDDVEIALRPAYAYAAALIDTPGAEYYLEQRVKFPSIDDPFGTADLIVRTGSTIHLIDFKFGALPVRALYPDGAEDILNAQLMFYAAAARHSLPAFFADVKNIVLVIVQPASIELDAEPISSAEITHAELDEFVAVYRAACIEALSDAPRLQRGTWCRFCPARPVCPAHTAPLLNLAQLVLPTPPLGGASPPAKAAYLQALADGLALFDAVKDIGTALREQAKAALENADIVAGYALTAGRAERHWRDDESTTIAALTSLGLTRDDVVAEELRSPKQVETRAKARRLKVPPELIVSHRSGVSLVRSENAHAPMRGPGEIAQLFSAALLSLGALPSKN
jgi:hypothetical protein